MIDDTNNVRPSSLDLNHPSLLARGRGAGRRGLRGADVPAETRGPGPGTGIGIGMDAAAAAGRHQDPVVEATVAATRGAPQRPTGAFLPFCHELPAPVHRVPARPRHVVPPALSVPHAAAAPAAERRRRRRRRMAPPEDHKPLHHPLKRL